MLKLETLDLNKIKKYTLFIPVCEDAVIHDDSSVSSLVKEASKIKDFSGKKDSELVLFDMAGTDSKRVVFMGLGKASEIKKEALMALAGKSVNRCIKHEYAGFSLCIPDASLMGMDKRDVYVSLFDGALLGNHLFDRYKEKKEKRVLETLTFLTESSEVESFASLAEEREHVCRGTLCARDWVTTPSNDKKPKAFARSIESCWDGSGIKYSVKDEEMLREMGFGAMLAVAAGSKNRPCLVVGDYDPGNAEKTVVLVGKGVTFDSGGINLKPSDGLADMKSDMAGAAAVAGTLLALSKTRPGVRVVGVMPMVENMLSGASYRPGDIYKSYKGKTIQIGNTDAEGRLILADALTWAEEEFKPDLIIDLATLTGACVIALGEKIAGVFSNDDTLAGAIVDAGDAVYERCWRMPMPEDYKEMLKSDLADLSNVGAVRWGGAITASLFLSEFVETKKWAHIDIAGPAYTKKESAYCGSGGTGFGVRLLYDLISERADELLK